MAIFPFAAAEAGYTYSITAFTSVIGPSPTPGAFGAVNPVISNAKDIGSNAICVST